MTCCTVQELSAPPGAVFLEGERLDLDCSCRRCISFFFDLGGGGRVADEGAGSRAAEMVAWHRRRQDLTLDRKQEKEWRVDCAWFCDFLV